MASAAADTAITSRRTVVSFADYRAAERAVDLLSDRGFPVEHVAIVGTGLRYVETVSGRRTTAGAAVNGAGQGVLYGLAWGLLFSLLFSFDSGSILGLIG